MRFDEYIKDIDKSMDKINSLKGKKRRVDTEISNQMKDIDQKYRDKLQEILIKLLEKCKERGLEINEILYGLDYYDIEIHSIKKVFDNSYFQGIIYKSMTNDWWVIICYTESNIDNEIEEYEERVKNLEGYTLVCLLNLLLEEEEIANIFTTLYSENPIKQINEGFKKTIPVKKRLIEIDNEYNYIKKYKDFK